MSQSESKGFRKLFGRRKTADEEKVEEEIISMVEEGHEQGVIMSDEVEMISNIFEFGDKEVHEIMTSRQKIIALNVEDTLYDALLYMLDNGVSRAPVINEDIDDIVGVMHLKDAMGRYLEDPNTKISDIMVDAYFVHANKSIQKLFRLMQTKKIHMAIVVDEYGQTEGLVAMEDILEVIVGNIFDEYDEEERDIIAIKGTKNYIVEGGTKLEELKDILEIEFPDEDFETLNGFLLYELGHLPKKGEKIQVTYENYVFRVLKLEGKMIGKVKISPVIETTN